MTLAELNAKYPSCSTCVSRTAREHRVKKKDHKTTWCARHNRPVEYETFTGPDGQPWIAGDVPCPDYAYVGPSPFHTSAGCCTWQRTRLLSRQNRKIFKT
jgi:hypothetical protein